MLPIGLFVPPILIGGSQYKVPAATVVHSVAVAVAVAVEVKVKFDEFRLASL